MVRARRQKLVLHVVFVDVGWRDRLVAGASVANHSDLQSSAAGLLFRVARARRCSCLIAPTDLCMILATSSSDSSAMTRRKRASRCSSLSTDKIERTFWFPAALITSVSADWLTRLSSLASY